MPAHALLGYFREHKARLLHMNHVLADLVAQSDQALEEVTLSTDTLSEKDAVWFARNRNLSTRSRANRGRPCVPRAGASTAR